MTKKLIVLFLMVLVGLAFSLGWLNLASLSAKAGARQGSSVLEPQPNSNYVLLAWNDLGMHCYNNDFKDLAVLPPYNTLWAQVIKVGDPPQIVTSGITVTYVFTDNTYSVGKTNFWTYAQQIFGLSNPLPDNIGLKGKGLSGVMDENGDHFIAEGIPLTEYRDSAPTIRYPYQLATITVMDASNTILAQNTVVAPTSTEMRCDNCHSDSGDATTTYPITPTGKVETNILTLHDYLNKDKYPAGHSGPLMDRRPILCAECHSSNALGAQGVSGVSSLSNAMHNHHKNLADITPNTEGCYNCHPGPQTQCLRDVMSQEENMTCVNCHGTIAQVATNTDPWLNEPRCDNCHGAGYRQNQALYRFSKGHGSLYCESCHDSTHAIAPSREPNDAIKFITLQGKTGTLRECTVCHQTQPAETFRHTPTVQNYFIYLPLTSR